MLQPIKDLAVPRRHTTSGPLYPIGVVLAGDALLDRQPHHLMHGAALALSLPSQEGGLFIGEPEGHCHAAMIPPCYHAGPAALETHTGRLTEAMLDGVLLRARELLPARRVG